MEREIPKRRKRDTFLVWVVKVMLGLTVANFLVTAVGGVAIVKTVDKTKSVEEQDRIALRGATYRICYRGMLDRAEIHTTYEKFHLVPELKRVQENLPILDCDPNLAGLAAVPLSVQEQEDFIHRYQRGKVDPTPGDKVLDKTGSFIPGD